MRLTEARIRQIVRGAIRESILKISPQFPPGTREKIIAVLRAFMPLMRKAADNYPSGERYIRLLDERPDQGVAGVDDDFEQYWAWDGAQEFEEKGETLHNEMLENPPVALSTLVTTINNLVVSKWMRDHVVADPADAKLLEGYDPVIYLTRVVVQLVMDVISLGSDESDPANSMIENFVDKLPFVWLYQIIDLRTEAGMDPKSALA